jgi:hypothetical protein
MTTARKYAAQPGADQIAAWKAAVSAHRKQQRRQRWKRPGPQITGIRIPPPERQAGQDAGR